jgi:hypothetical protein
MDVSLLSKKSNLTASTYRQLKDGTIKMAELLNFTDVPGIKKGIRMILIYYILYLKSRSIFIEK